MINQKSLLFIQTLHKYIAEYSSFTEQKEFFKTFSCLEVNNKERQVKKTRIEFYYSWNI